MKFSKQTVKSLKTREFEISPLIVNIQNNDVNHRFACLEMRQKKFGNDLHSLIYLLGRTKSATNI